MNNILICILSFNISLCISMLITSYKLDKAKNFQFHVLNMEEYIKTMSEYGISTARENSFKEELSECKKITKNKLLKLILNKKDYLILVSTIEAIETNFYNLKNKI